MGYMLISEPTDETLSLSSREWEMLRILAAFPSGWEPQEDRDYTRGRISPKEASEMAESLKGLLPYLSREAPEERPEEPRTVAELRNSLGYIEGDPLTFFGDVDRRHKVEGFVQLASVGAFEVLPRPHD